jgi:hypothetical protein
MGENSRTEEAEALIMICGFRFVILLSSMFYFSFREKTPLFYVPHHKRDFRRVPYGVTLPGIS